VSSNALVFVESIDHGETFFEPTRMLIGFSRKESDNTLDDNSIKNNRKRTLLVAMAIVRKQNKYVVYRSRFLSIYR
jgi:hypothetical protein